MKTIKTKKSVGKAYVFSYNNFENGPYYNTNQTEKLAIEARDNKRCRCDYNRISEISEVELFETVEEQVPEVGLAWVFFYKTLIGNIEYVVSLNERDAKFRRNTCKNNGFECSAIKLLREEF